MSNQPSVPDELIAFDRQFSLRTTWKVNSWLFLAAIVSALSDLIFPAQVKQWPAGWQIAIALAEFIAVLLWTRDVTRWIRSMDELQRRITTELFLFAVGATFFFMLLWMRLDAAKFFTTVFGPPFCNGTWGIYSVFHAFALLGGFYGLGFLIFKRRYK